MKEESYKIPDNDPNYVLVHKRALVAMSHCVGLAIQSFAVCSGSEMQETTLQFSHYANSHVHELSQQQLDFVIEQLIKNQGKSGILDLKDMFDNESKN
ncbi:hypothetical protein Riv7116_2105 [Rivularia sp. PCC 7116]|uniref:hypothetical protein n=1 Tax=Rivularia sp. PCC 7116 TaxID=373994 RepID=UPI00029EE0B0|nr:hypothetical protein [Rivularia sp. PCC 7116]AFY54636.1 hypothetical protein Riv7116_2105 [Rivularia sp. PCC 7116]